MKHVFISYVREDSDTIDKICEDLESHGIHVWIDRKNIKPGKNWRKAIKDAIREGAYFLACFSNSFMNRNRTEMYEELTIAVGELRLRPRDRAWLIPILLDECEVPDLDISTIENIRDIQWVEYYRDPKLAIERIVRTIQSDAIDPTLEGILREFCRHLDSGNFIAVNDLLSARHKEIDRFANSKHLMFFLAILESINGNPRASNLLANLSENEFDYSLNASIEASRQLFSSGNFEGALSLIKKAEQPIMNRGAHILKGLCFLGLNDRNQSSTILNHTETMHWCSDREKAYWAIPHAVLLMALGDCESAALALDECIKWSNKPHNNFEYPFVGCSIDIDKSIRAMMVAPDFKSLKSELKGELSFKLRGYRSFVGRCMQILRRDQEAIPNWKNWIVTKGWSYPKNIAHFRTRIKSVEKELFQLNA